MTPKPSNDTNTAPITFPESLREAYTEMLASLPPAIRKLLAADPVEALKKVEPCADGIGYRLLFAGGAIYCHPGLGLSVVVGKPYAKWQSLGAEAGILGYPLSAMPGDVVFERGRVFAGQNPFVIYGPLYAKWLQLPEPRPRPITDVEQMGRYRVLGIALDNSTAILWESGTQSAFWVEGQIHNKWMAMGGMASPLGPPRSDWFTPIKSDQGLPVESVTVCAMTFKNGMMLRTPGGVFALYGPIYDKWMSLGGALGKWGLPETDIGAYLGINFADFEHGVIFQRDQFTGAARDLLFKISAMMLSGSEHGSYEKDLYVNAEISGSRHGKIINPNPYSVSVRLPQSGSFDATASEEDAKRAQLRINNVRHDTYFDYRLDAWDQDVTSRDDHQGTLSGRVTIADLFWLDGKGAMTDGDFTATLKIIEPNGEPAVDGYFRHNDFWAFSNFGQEKLSYQRYAETFTDVGTADNVILDPLNVAYFEAFYKSLAENGHCFGMALEAIYSLKGRGAYPRGIYWTVKHPVTGGPLITPRNGSCNPIDFDAPPNGLDMSKLSGLIQQIQIKHGYQLGVSCVAWFVSQFLSGMTHNPRDVFKLAKAFREAGDDPVLCFTPSYWSSAGHTVLPYRFEGESTGQQRIYVADPNHPWCAWPEANAYGHPIGDHKDQIYVELPFRADDNNWFRYDKNADTGQYAYEGRQWTGGRMYCIPYSVLSFQPATPGSALLETLLGLAALIICAGDASVKQITDEGGRSFYKTDRPEKWEDIVEDGAKRPRGLARVPLFDAAPGGEVYGVANDVRVNYFEKSVKPGVVPTTLKYQLGFRKKDGAYSFTAALGHSQCRLAVSGGARGETDEVELSGLKTLRPTVQITANHGTRVANLEAVVKDGDPRDSHHFNVSDISLAQAQSVRMAIDVPRHALTVEGPLGGRTLSISLRSNIGGVSFAREGHLALPAECRVIEVRRAATKLAVTVRQKIDGAVVAVMKI